MVAMVEEELATLDEPGRRAVLQFLTGTVTRMEDHLEQLCGRPAAAAEGGSVCPVHAEESS